MVSGRTPEPSGVRPCLTITARGRAALRSDGVSPRHNRREPGRGDGEVPARGVDRAEAWPDGDWVVRQVAGDRGKAYRCPGCDQEIPPGVGHVVAWRSDGFGAGSGPDARRHWHGPCWRARMRRGTVVQRSRNAPRHG